MATVLGLRSKNPSCNCHRHTLYSQGYMLTVHSSFTLTPQCSCFRPINSCNPQQMLSGQNT